jgi:hypothetical protein
MAQTGLKPRFWSAQKYLFGRKNKNSISVLTPFNISACATKTNPPVQGYEYKTPKR